MGSNRTRNQRKLRDVGKRRFRQTAQVVFGDCAHPVMYVRRVPRSRIVAGAVLLARVPYDQISDYKIRPVVVLSRDGARVWVRPCTTSPRATRYAGNVPLVDLDEAGLSRATTVRPRVIALPLTDLLDVRGDLSARDLARIQHPAAQGRTVTAATPVTPIRTQSRVTPAALPIPTSGAAA